MSDACHVPACHEYEQRDMLSDKMITTEHASEFVVGRCPVIISAGISAIPIEVFPGDFSASPGECQCSTSKQATIISSPIVSSPPNAIVL
jgi:hypothetical protein